MCDCWLLATALLIISVDVRVVVDVDVAPAIGEASWVACQGAHLADVSVWKSPVLGLNRPAR